MISSVESWVEFHSVIDHSGTLARDSHLTHLHAHKLVRSMMVFSLVSNGAVRCSQFISTLSISEEGFHRWFPFMMAQLINVFYCESGYNWVDTNGSAILLPISGVHLYKPQITINYHWSIDAYWLQKYLKYRIKIEEFNKRLRETNLVLHCRRAYWSFSGKLKLYFIYYCFESCQVSVM